MFDDKIGDVYKGGRKIGEVRRSNSGGGLAVGYWWCVYLPLELLY